MTRRHYAGIIFLLGLLSAISPFSVDMYLSGFPAIAQDLHTPISTVQLSLTAYLIGLSGGQLFYGPLLDRYGRKRPLYVGLCVYMLASIAGWPGISWWNVGDWYSKNSLIIVLFLFFTGQGLIGPNASALALMPFVRHAGSAVALMGSFRIGFGAFISGAVSVLHNNTAMPMVAVMTLCIVSSLLILGFGQRMIQQQSRQMDVERLLGEGLL
ncbi:MFS transporter [Spirosoma arcticum]